MGLSTIVIIRKNVKLKAEIEQKANIIKQLEADNYSLTFKKGELEEYIKEGNTRLKQKIDSVTKAYDIKLKDVKKVTVVKVETRVDTIKVPVETSLSLADSLYHSEFSVDSACFKISGRIIGMDPMPALVFTKLGYENESYYVVYKEPKKWWQFFKKRKTMIKVFSKCGNVNIQELIEEK